MDDPKFGQVCMVQECSHCPVTGMRAGGGLSFDTCNQLRWTGVNLQQNLGGHGFSLTVPMHRVQGGLPERWSQNGI